MRRATVALALVAFMAAGASATVVDNWVEVPIPAGLGLDGYRCWDLTITTDDIWSNSEIIVVLDQGTFWNHAMYNQNYPQPGFFPLLPDLEFDTFVSGYDPSQAYPNSLEAPTILGKHPSEGVGGAVFTATKISVAWADPLPADATGGPFTILRMTMSNDADGNIYDLNHFDNSMPGVAQPGKDIRQGYYIQDGAVVPEPATIGLVALGGLALIRRKK